MRLKLLLLFCISILTHSTLHAQMPHDAIYMPKKTTCAALVYSNSTWTKYWEGSLLRNNLNMGTHTNQSFMPMLAIGATDRMNVILALPYISTKTSAGNLKGQFGVQDLSVWVKYKLLAGKKGLSLHGVAGATAPMSNYVPDFLPMSIGLKSKTVSAKIIGNYLHKTGAYINTHATFTYRSNIKVDRDAYQADGRVFNSNEVKVPHAADAGIRLGYLKNGSRLQAELFAEHFTCLDGDNIRRNDMPFPTNNMQMTTAGFYGKYQPKNVGLNIKIARVLDGLNAGQSMTYSAGVLYQFNFTKKEKK
jgi:hypothetical protein